MENLLATLERRLPTTANPIERIDLLNQIGEAARHIDPERMLVVAQEAQTLLARSPRQSRPYLHSYGVSLELLGYYYFRRGDFDTAYNYYQSAIHYFIQIYDDVSRCQAWTYSCLCQAHLGHWADAMEEAVACLDLAVAIGDRASEIRLWLVMGTVYTYSSDHMRSIDAFSKALQISEEIQEPHEQIVVLYNLANAHIEAGQAADGIVYADQALALSRQHRSLVEMGHILYTLARGYHVQGDLEKARFLYQQCYEQSPLSEHIRTRSLLGQGQVHADLHQTTDALEYLLQALPLAEAAQVQPEWYKCHQALADAFAQQGNWAKAYHHHLQYYVLKESVFNIQSDLRLKMLEVTFRTEDAYRQADLSQRQAAEMERRLKQQLADLKTEANAEAERHRRDENEKSHLLEVVRKQGEQIQNLTQWMISQQRPNFRQLSQAFVEGYLQNMELLTFHIDVAMQNYLDMPTVQSEPSAKSPNNYILTHLQDAASVVKQVQNVLQSIMHENSEESAQSPSLQEDALHLLSRREREVLNMLAQGKSTAEISQTLNVTEGTVRTYRYRIMQKLEIEDMAHLIHFAILHQQNA